MTAETIRVDVGCERCGWTRAVYGVSGRDAHQTASAMERTHNRYDCKERR